VTAVLAEDTDDGKGENICPECSGSGQVDGRECRTCGGTGTVTEPIGGA
jgi:DnaJ-class molecular chaperone